MVDLLIAWLISAAVLMAVAYFVPSVHVKDFKSALIAAIVFGLINSLVKPILVFLTFPVTLLTLGLFYIILNGLLFWMAGSITKHFRVDGFLGGLIGAIVYSVLMWLINAIIF